MSRAERHWTAVQDFPDRVDDHGVPNFELKFDEEGTPIAAVSVPQIPPRGLHLWAAFYSLGRHRGENRVAALPPGLIRDWADLRGGRFSMLELDALEAMDQAYCETLAAEIENNRQRSGNKGQS